MKDVWKRRFFILLGMVVLVMGGLLFLMIRSPSQNIIENNSSSGTGEDLVTLELQLTDGEVRDLILKEIESQGYHLKLNLSPKFQLQMPVNFLGQELEFYLEGNAQESEDGNIKIDITSVQVGGLALPRQMALNLLKLALGEGSSLHVENEGLVIDLNRLNLDSPVQLRAISFRPTEQKYVFEIKFPKKMIFEGMEGAL